MHPAVRCAASHRLQRSELQLRGRAHAGRWERGWDAQAAAGLLPLCIRVMVCLLERLHGLALGTPRAEWKWPASPFHLPTALELASAP